MPSIPKTPCPVGGLVPIDGGVWPIKAAKSHPVFGWVYTIHAKQKDGPLFIHWNVSQQDIVDAMNATTQFKVGQSVKISKWGKRTILQRKWNFKTGTMCYLIEGNRDGQEWPTDQDKLVEMIRVEAEEHA